MTSTTPAPNPEAAVLAGTPMLTQRFTDAFAFAAAAHETQLRKGTRIPYLSHLMAVAALTLEHGGDEDLAIAALLHDAPEDQGGRPMLDRIRQRFGDGVADVVAGCTDTFENPKPDYTERKRNYIEHLKHASIDTCVVSAADKLHNARAIHADLRREGARVWTRFNANPATLQRFYSEVADVLRERLAGHRAQALADTLLREVAAIWPPGDETTSRSDRTGPDRDAGHAVPHPRT